MTQDKAHPTPPAVPTRISVSAERIDAITDVMSEVLATVKFPVPYGELENKFARALAGLRAVQSLAAPVASNTTAEPAPIQPAGVEVERDAARYRWLRTPPNNLNPAVYGPTGGLLRRDNYLDAAIDQALAAASQGDRGKT